MRACATCGRRALIRGASTREAAAVAGEDDVWLVPRDQIESSGYVLHTLRAALWCLTTTDSYRDCVLTAVNPGGDADTTAAVAGALAGIVYGFEDEREERDSRGIPGEWGDALRGWRIIAAVVCGAPLDVEDWDAELAGSALGGPEALTAQSARDFGDDRSRAALLQADPERREALFGEAARWFASGVELGDAQCATNLGVMYLYGHVPAQDPALPQPPALNAASSSAARKAHAIWVTCTAMAVAGRPTTTPRRTVMSAPMNCARSRWTSTTRMTGPSSR
ncbi:ADP-ribosylglycohydrolase family protein [Bifidobacterium pseudolongum]|uniref:ADP-ribosylglycohydrolase family protein n=1 Tax=Bifidobacterium pseudolongum TaxID=1694 RepID=UPI001F5C632A|nr:ADP-ribosylglycohydrolase family protein [Bifidobacterium pseudolongum]